MTPTTPVGALRTAVDLNELAVILDESARANTFSGAISIDEDGQAVMCRGYGWAERVLRVPNTAQTRFAVGSVSKAFTALAVMSLIEDGTLSLASRVRPMLGRDLPDVHADVTLEHLLAHTSGIGDYRDEVPGADATDYVLTEPTHTLAETAGFLPLLDGRAQVDPPGTRFAVNHAAYLVLALAAERASGTPFHDLVADRVLAPAGLAGTGYPRLDELPAGTATGYLRNDSVRTNVLHLPVRGNGDGGAHTTVGDLSRFWRALADGRIVSAAAVERMVRPRHADVERGLHSGLGFWLDADGPGWILEGAGPGVSVRTRFDPVTRTTVTVVGNSSDAAWPVIRRYVDWLDRG
ncbi:class A beta-lactamase-related serine hydrolase [Citricoccus sp. SGAir0253]|uniref:serine hydrolase domain-containing protein n=1 Tax=Citricoccus sp. SGAir0253 TaxID=2567881 RepID=UPI0010CD2FAA|nr:serine hydrolase domain-containing protein [Citricoccus sp. SGAir0253]QCU77577.1 class A beta-lactamase-related serine hydrolase [Citricoccus sp. SGAir0253]